MVWSIRYNTVCRTFAVITRRTVLSILSSGGTTNILEYRVVKLSLYAGAGEQP